MATAYADSSVAAPNGASKIPDTSGLTKRQRIDRIHQGIWQPMLPYRPQWETLGLYVQPDRPMWCSTDNDLPRFTDRIFDNEASLALRDLGAVMISKLSNPSVPWFELTTGDITADKAKQNQLWLTDTRDRILLAMDRSDFYAEAETVYQDTALFGTSAIMIEPDAETIIRCEALAIGSYAITHNARRRVDTIAREFRMTAAQMATEFGYENLSQPVQQALQNHNAQSKFTIRHMIYPNPVYVKGAEDYDKRKFAECYWELAGPEDKNETFLREGGYHEFPVPCPRWGPLTPGTPYGTRCPGMLCLGDIKLLQAWEKATLNAWQKVVNPPTVSGPGFKNKTVYSIPGANTVDEQLGGANDSTLKPMYQIAPNLMQSEQKAEQVRRRIARAFYGNLVAPVLMDERQQRATAAEIYQARDEQYGLLGAVVERNADDFHDPAIARIFGIMWRAGLILPPPEEMSGQQLRVRLISAMAAAQKAVRVAGIERHASFLIGIAVQAPQLAPILDTLDADALSRQHAEATGSPPDVTRDKKETAQVRALREQAMAQQQAAQNGPAMAGAAKDLSQADMTKDSALTRLLGAGGAR